MCILVLPFLARLGRKSIAVQQIEVRSLWAADHDWEGGGGLISSLTDSLTDSLSGSLTCLADGSTGGPTDGLTEGDF